MKLALVVLLVFFFSNSTSMACSPQAPCFVKIKAGLVTNNGFVKYLPIQKFYLGEPFLKDFKKAKYSCTTDFEGTCSIKVTGKDTILDLQTECIEFAGYILKLKDKTLYFEGKDPKTRVLNLSNNDFYINDYECEIALHPSLKEKYDEILNIPVPSR